MSQTLLAQRLYQYDVFSTSVDKPRRACLTGNKFELSKKNCVSYDLIFHWEGEGAVREGAGGRTGLDWAVHW